MFFYLVMFFFTGCERGVFIALPGSIFDPITSLGSSIKADSYR
jgi:hypothetical protein